MRISKGPRGLLCLALLAGGSALGCEVVSEQADLVLTNGKIVTMEESTPEVEALAVRGGTILALGTAEEIAALIGEGTEVIDLAGHLAVPGFIEGHGHFLSLGRARLQLDLTTAETWDEIVERVEAAAAGTPPGAWIVGRGWHQSKWTAVPEPNVEGLPIHASLSAVSPDNPVLLTHASGHASFVNAKAMELAKIDASTPDPAGGEIVRDSRGSPIGALRENAQALVTRARHEAWNEAEVRRIAASAAQECLSKGITSFQDAGSSFQEIDFFKRLAEESQLPLRLWVMVREDNEELAKKLASYRLIDSADGHLTVRAIKRGIDGALGTHGAWLFEPYADLPQSRGLNTTPLDALARTAELAVKHDFQLCVHAIGDRANHETLNVFEETFRRHGSGGNRRWRIEHVQHLHPDDVPRFAHLGVVASMQGIHCTSDALWALRRLGTKRAEEGAYVWRRLLDAGAIVSNGTDAPVEDVSPIQSFYASVARRLEDGSVFFPQHRMTRREALRSYTWNAAYAAFEEEIKGSLAPGKLADITALSRDILSVPEEEIQGTEVLYTIVGGKVVYRQQDG